jgi:uncharacterized membrane protein
MTTLTKNPSWKSSPGFALISVLALVSLAALTATAFLASARLERQASSSIGKTTLLDMALDSGKFCVTQLINDYSQTDLGNTAIVTYWRTNWTDELGYPFIAKTKTSGGNNGQNSAMWYYAPLFSPAGVTNLGTNDIQNAMRFTNIHQGTFSNDMQSFMRTSATNGFTNIPGLTNSKCVQIPLLGGRTSPPVGWVYIDQEKRKFGSSLTNTSPVVRIAWFTEDLEGLIDADRMGATTNRSTGTNSEEISLSSATGTNGTALVSSPSIFTNKRAAYISYGILSTNGGLANPTNARYFASGLRAWAPTPASSNNGALAWIPVGIPVSGTSAAPKGYANQGYTKLNINTLVTSSGSDPVGTIASAITNNLPSFRARSGAMNSNAYISNIAANIVDYADTDPTPTSIDSTLGFDNYPLPVVFSDKIAWNLNVANPSNSTIQVTTYVQLWNCSTLTSPAVTYTLQNNFQDTYLKSNGTASTIRLFSTNLSNSLSVPPLGPNQIIILTTTNTTNVGANASFPGGLMISNVLGINNNSSTAYATYTNLFELKLGSTIISQHKGPYTRIGQKIANGSWDFEGTVLTMSRDKTTPAPIGDPRMLRFISNSTATPLEYRSSSSGNLKWGGYANFKDHPTATAPWNGHPDNWPDGRKGAPASLTGTGQTSGAGGSIPVAVGTPITLPGTAPAILSRNGKFLTVTELGNIFDPFQWKPPTSFTDNSKYASCSIDANWTTNGAELYGGGTTLRIGRAEHQRFAFTNMYGNSVPPIPNMGMSSAALLDIFCLTNGTSVAGGPYTLGGGKINLNTAPAPVLRALAGGILLTNDPAQVPSNYAIPPAMAEAFAQGVMRFRSKYPFLTPSHLSFIGTDPAWPNTNSWPTNSVFGNTNTISLSTAPGNTFGSTARITVTEWSDQAAEEWFSKIFALSSCQSHNYRIYVVAQLVATNSAGQINPIGPLVKKYYQVFFQNGSAVSAPTKWPPTTSTYPNNDVSTWTPTGYATDIFKSYY